MTSRFFEAGQVAEVNAQMRAEGWSEWRMGGPASGPFLLAPYGDLEGTWFGVFHRAVHGGAIARIPFDLDACAVARQAEDGVRAFLASHPEPVWLANLGVGQAVYWVDPDEGASSGTWRVARIDSESGRVDTRDTVIALVNDAGSEAEVFSHELWSAEPRVIHAPSEEGYWCNEFGWGDVSSATLFARGEDWSLPMASGGDAGWRDYSDALSAEEAERAYLATLAPGEPPEEDAAAVRAGERTQDECSSYAFDAEAFDEMVRDDMVLGR
jgi:hypothetical protein